MAPVWLPVAPRGYCAAAVPPPPVCSHGAFPSRLVSGPHAMAPRFCPPCWSLPRDVGRAGCRHSLPSLGRRRRARRRQGAGRHTTACACSLLSVARRHFPMEQFHKGCRARVGMQTFVAGTSAAVFDWVKCRRAAALVCSSSSWVRAFFASIPLPALLTPPPLRPSPGTRPPACNAVRM